jgi:hypothetical protein
LTAAPGWHLLVCGPEPHQRAECIDQLCRNRAGLLAVHHLSADGPAGRRLGVRPDHTALYVIRPDGHIGYRSGGTGWTALADYLDRWLPTGVP